MTDPRTLSQRLVSPHAFDGNGPVPVQVVVAGRDVAKLHVKFVNQWTPGADRLFTNGEIRMLLDAAALQAEWMRELYEARDLLLARLRAAEAQGDKLAEAVDTFRFAYMGQLGHVVIPDALAEMEDAAREWKARS